MKTITEKHLITEINYILRRNCNIPFLKKALTRLLILERNQIK